MKHVEGHDEDVHNKSRRNASTSDSSQPLRRDPRLGQYYEYDLSKMQNSKGGFLIEDDHGLGEKTENEIRKEKQREMERTLAASYEPDLALTLTQIPSASFVLASKQIDKSYKHLALLFVINANKPIRKNSVCLQKQNARRITSSPIQSCVMRRSCLIFSNGTLIERPGIT